jgi:hypothetical protein
MISVLGMTPADYSWTSALMLPICTVSRVFFWFSSIGEDLKINAARKEVHKEQINSCFKENPEIKDLNNRIIKVKSEASKLQKCFDECPTDTSIEKFKSSVQDLKNEIQNIGQNRNLYSASLRKLLHLREMDLSTFFYNLLAIPLALINLRRYPLSSIFTCITSSCYCGLSYFLAFIANKVPLIQD